MQHSWRDVLAQSCTEKFKSSKLYKHIYIYPMEKHGELLVQLKLQILLTSYAEPGGRVIFILPQLEHFS